MEDSIKIKKNQLVEHLSTNLQPPQTNGSFKTVFDKLIQDSMEALESKNYLELMKIAITIKTKARMIKNNIEETKRLLNLASSIEKRAKELTISNIP